jgi:hypothetical protein
LQQKAAAMVWRHDPDGSEEKRRENRNVAMRGNASLAKEKGER